MSPEVTAAIIAASVSFLTLIGTLAAQYFGRRATSRDTQKSFAEQHEQLDKTLAAQGEQLDRTLAEQRIRTLNERFATAAGQLGDDKPPTVRLAGVYAMAGLADDWKSNRQTCIDVLCAYLRLPYEPHPGEEAPAPERLAFRASREVRHTVIRVITAHLEDDAATSWRGLNFDFTGVVFDGGSFAGARFSGGTVGFGGAEFSGGTVDFNRAVFSGGTVDFGGAEFSGGQVRFDLAEFSCGQVRFDRAEFSGGQVRFDRAEFSGSTISFIIAQFSGGQVDFGGAEFSGGQVGFGGARFSGGTVDFTIAKFSGGTVDFSHPRDWSFPPAFSWTDTPLLGVKLPEKEDQSQV
jgi:Pentapeptide repeats (9 copies)